MNLPALREWTETPGWKEAHAKALEEAKALAVENLGLPADALKVIRGCMDFRPAVRAVAEWGETGEALLVLSGNARGGKTVAAASWLCDYLRRDDVWPGPGSAMQLRGRAPVWMTAAKLARVAHYEAADVDRLLLAPRLVLDDLSVEFLDAKGYYMSLLDEVINERQAEGRPTLLTTNLDAATFKLRYGERITGRIREKGRFVGVSFTAQEKSA